MNSGDALIEPLKKLGYEVVYDYHIRMFGTSTDRKVTAPLSLKATEDEINRKMFE